MNVSMELITMMTGATTILVAIVGFYTIRMIRSNDEAIRANLEQHKNTDREIAEIKYNYLDRFDRMKDQIMESEIRIISNIVSKIKHLEDDK